MQTTTVFTDHYLETGVSTKNNKPYVRNDFKTEDGQRFSTFNEGLASKILSIGLNVPVVVEFVTKNSEYPNNHDLKGVEAAVVENLNNGQEQFLTPADPKFWPSQPPPTGPPVTNQIKPVDRNAGLARAIEFCGVTGEDLKEAYKDGSLFEMADVFAAYGALNQKPSFNTEQSPTV